MRAVALAGLAVVVAVLGYRLGAGDGPGALAAAVGGFPAALLLALALAARPTGPGPPAVGGVDALPGTDPAELVRLAAALHGGTGPVGRALVRAAGAPLPAVSDVDGTPEAGLRGVVSELREDAAGPVVVAHAVLAGPRGWLAAHGVAEPGTAGPLLVAWDGRARGSLTVAPGPRRPAWPVRAAVALGASGAAAGALLAPPPPLAVAAPLLALLGVALLGCLPQTHPIGDTAG